MRLPSIATLRIWLDALTKVGLLLGGLFTGWQYLEGKQADRIERTFGFVEALKKGETAAARNTISAELRGRLIELTRIRATPMPPAVAASVHAYIVRTLVSSAREGQGLGVELDRLLDLFDEVQVCIEKHLCDAETAQAFLGSYGRTLWANFRPYIEDQWQSIPGYGTGLQRFVATLPAEVTP